MKEKKPLYRKVNTCTRGVHHQEGSDAKYDRNTKKGMSKSMKKCDKRGLDYTPLYKFLLSKVGQDWDAIHSEAISRLDKEEPIYYMVARNEDEKCNIWGDTSKYSKLYVDDNNILQKVYNVKNEMLYPGCSCCTHTFNGIKLINTHDDFIKNEMKRITLNNGTKLI